VKILETTWKNWFDIKTRGKWIILFFAILVILLGLGATAVPTNPAEAKAIYDQLQNEPYTVTAIFGNNFFYCMIVFIPVIGPIFAGLIVFHTGILIANIASATGVNSFRLFTTTLMFPHAWLELFAYSFAMSQSIILTKIFLRSIRRSSYRKYFQHELVRTCITITVIALLLILAAIIEVVLIALVS